MTLAQLLLGQMGQFKAAGYDVTGISAPGPHVAKLERAGIRHLAIPVTRRLGPLADLRALVTLAGILRRERFDIIHTHTPKGGLLGQYAGLLARTPLRLHTIHGLYFPGSMQPSQRQLYVWLERITLAPSHYNFSQNPEDVPVAIAEHISRADRIQQIGNGIALNRFDPAVFDASARRTLRAELGLDDHHVVIGMVGRLVAEKGYPEAFAAIAELRRTHPNVRALFVGGFEDKPDAIQASALAAAGIADIAQFTGLVGDVERLYAAFDIFMLPSHREGIPRAVMEASAMGKPCVVTDVRGCRQTVDAGVTGLLVPAKEPVALAAALARLVADPSLRERMGRAAREKALREFDEDRVVADLLAAYDRLAVEHGLTPARP